MTAALRASHSKQLLILIAPAIGLMACGPLPGTLSGGFTSSVSANAAFAAPSNLPVVDPAENLVAPNCQEQGATLSPSNKIRLEIFAAPQAVSAKNFYNTESKRGHKVAIDDFSNLQDDASTLAAIGTNKDFAARITTSLTLAPNAIAGAYQLALWSSDSAVLSIKGANGQWVTSIDNDGTHPGQLRCAPTGISLSNDHELGLQIDMYRGHGKDKGFVLLIRKISDWQSLSATPGGDANCAMNLAQAEAAGWQPVSAAQLVLPIQLDQCQPQ